MLEPKRGQGRPLLRTEQRSAEKVLGAAPADSRAGHTNTSASVLADAGKRHEPKDKAQLRRGAGLENMPPAGERQAGAGYAQLLRANAGAGAAGKAAAAQLPARRVLRPAFRPSGSNGWRFGQPTVTVSPPYLHPGPNSCTHPNAPDISMAGKECQKIALKETKVAFMQSCLLCDATGCPAWR